MRFLSGRADHVRHRAAQGQPEPQRRADRRSDGWQYLPLRHLQPHQDRNPPGLDSLERGQGMSQLPNDFALSNLTNLSRRGFLKGVGATGALVLAASWGWQDAFAEDKPKQFGADGMPNGWVDDPKVYVSIAADGTVTVVCNRSEMGQGVRTSLSMVVADELDADWALVKVQQAPGDEVRFGNQDTDGSRSMRYWYEPMRRCGASVRTNGACCANRRCPGCRSALHRPAPVAP